VFVIIFITFSLLTCHIAMMFKSLVV